MCAFLLNCVAYYVKTTKLSCDCYWVGLLWNSSFCHITNLSYKNVIEAVITWKFQNNFESYIYLNLKFNCLSNWMYFEHINFAAFKHNFIRIGYIETVAWNCNQAVFCTSYKKLVGLKIVIFMKEMSKLPYPKWPKQKRTWETFYEINDKSQKMKIFIFNTKL